MSPILSRLIWAQGFGRRPYSALPGSAIYNNIEDFFSTYLYYGATATVSHIRKQSGAGSLPTPSTDSPFTGTGEGYNSVEFALNKAIEITPSSEFAFGSNEDFTIEWWEKRFEANGNPGVEKDPYMTVMDIGNTSAGLHIALDGTNQGKYRVQIGAGGVTIIDEGTGVAAGSGWHHYAFTVESLGGNQQKGRFYRDGVQQAHNTVTSISWGVSNDDWTVGGQKSSPANYNFQGRVSNFRLTKGICRYKDNFSIPTKPFSDWADGNNTNTLFVCCKSADVLGADGDVFTNGAYTKKTRVKYLEKGGLVWIKCRSAGQAPALIDTIRGRDKFLMTDSTSGQTTDQNNISAFTGDGFSVGNDSRVNNSGDFYTSWSFARDPKFMDIVEYTGDGATSRYINHALDNIPGFIMIKNIDQGNTGWVAIHRNSESGVSDPGQAIHQMNVPYSKVWDLGDTPDAQYPSLGGPDNRTNQFHVTSNWNNYEVSGGAGYMGTNNNGEKYIAYIFAHDESANGMIRCGYFNTSGNGISPVDENKTSYNDLGWEPQWILTKEVCEDTTNYPATSGNWLIWDDKRGVGKYYRIIEVDSSNTEAGGGGSTDEMRFYPRGFRCENFAAGRRFIYIAIRKGLLGNPKDTKRKAVDLFALAKGGSSSSTYDSNNGGFTTQVADGGETTEATGQQAYLTPGSYTWTCPANVTKVHAVCIGAGGGGTSSSGNFEAGGGGGLGWKNNIPVTPGQTYTVVVGDHGPQHTQGSDGQDSYFINATTVKGGGGKGNNQGGGDFVGDGGGNGGTYTTYGGGGGAGGYSADGNSESGGAGGKGAANGLTGGGAGGGGVGVMGEGASGINCGGDCNNTNYGATMVGGGGGSGGANGTDGVVPTFSGGYSGGVFGGPGGDYGGGGGGNVSSSYGTNQSALGAPGAVRLIWGEGRAFPSTNTADQPANQGTSTAVESYGFAPDAGFLLSNGPRETFARVVGTSSRGGGAGGNVYQQSWDLDGNDPGNNTSSNKWPMYGGNVGGNNFGSGDLIWTWRRAKGFFDTAYFYSNGNANQPYPHNLGVVPEMIWQRRLDGNQTGMYVYHKDLPVTQYLETSTVNIATSSGLWGDGTVPHTKTHFTMGNIAASNQENIAFLFATCPGFSKVGKYDTLANGDPQNIDCGFTTGARALILKRITNAASGDGWFCFDTERGIAQSGVSSGSVSFSGNVTDTIKIQGPSNGGGNGLQFGTGTYTIEFWIKTNANAGWIMFNAANNTGFRICLGNNGTGGGGYDGKIEINEQVNNADQYTNSTSTVNDGVWHHVAFSRGNGTSLKLFIDGQQEGTGGTSRDISSNDDCHFGRRQSGGGIAFNGQLSNFRATNAELYTGNFTVPTSPLTQTGDTKLLFLQSDTDPLASTVTPGTISYGGAPLTASADNPFTSAVSPYMRLDNTQSQTTTGSPWVKKTDTGFRIESGNDINVANETYIYYAIA